MTQRSIRWFIHLSGKASISVLVAICLLSGQARASAQVIELLEKAVKATEVQVLAKDEQKLAKIGKLAGVAETARISRIARLRDEALTLAKAGKLSDAARRCDELAIIEREAGTEASREAALQFERAASSLRKEELARIRASLSALSVPPPAPQSFQEVLDHLPQDQGEIFKSLEKVAPRTSRIAFVQADVKQFVRDFALGAGNPGAYLIDIHVANKKLLAKWKATPVEKRVFVAGSSRDSARVRKLRSSLEAEGFVVFFYKFCVEASGELCRSESVGAFFATAGNAILVDTPAAVASRYVPHEIVAAQRFRNGQGMIFMVTPSEVTVAAQAGFKGVRAVVITPDPNVRQQGRVAQ